MKVFIWPKFCSLPSFDYKCLITQAYLKFMKVTITFEYCNNPWKSPNGDFPVLKIEGLPSVCGFKNIIQQLQSDGLDLDSIFEDDEKVLIESYKILIEEKLLPALEFFFWVESKCFTELVRPTFAKMLIMPLGLYTPIKYRNNIIKKLETFYQNISESEMENKIICDAKETLNYLSNKLDLKDYMLGNKPSSIDAYIFGILAPLLKSNLPNPVMANHINACPNLVQLINKVLEDYFPPTQEEIEEQKRIKKEEERKKLNLNDEDLDFPHKKRNILIASAVCISSMFMYAIFTGILKFEIIRPNK